MYSLVVSEPLPAKIHFRDLDSCVRHGGATASPTLENWQLFGKIFSTFGQIIAYSYIRIQVR